MAYDPRTFNPGLITGAFIDQFGGPDNPMSGDDFQHIWSGRGEHTTPDFGNGYQEPSWVPDTDVNEGKVGYSPRENFLDGNQSGDGSVSLRTPTGGGEGSQSGPQPGGQPDGPRAAPAQPRQPFARAGQTGVLPFKPMNQNVGPNVTPKMTNLFGSLGGLKGGGLGLPLDPTSNQTSDPIEGLIQLLRKGGL